ncbi:aminotransferase family protein [Apiospora kogelbergensis]|uniref:Aminotransferase family protein n=1 Tax=Apiospora kogelbergensis TaxID=1337665 RepID=A0AAW0Q8A3_9PEZI
MAPPQVLFGAPMRHAHFAFSPTYIPLNHGSYGAHPVSVRAAHLALRAEVEAAPDPFIALDFSRRLTRPRELAAQMLRCPVDELVFVPNATTGIDTVLKNIVWQPGDVILCYEVVYSSVANGLEYLRETTPVEIRVVHVPLPVADDELVRTMVDAARAINADKTTVSAKGNREKRVRLAICDTIISGPGARVPFERLVPALQAEGAMVLVDGAHGIGHIDLDLSVLRPDFFVTNLHKWLFVPRGCAAFVVRKEHQHLIRTTLPTSHGFKPRKPLKRVVNADAGKDFVEMFGFTGTADTTNWLCVEAALKFREEVCGGEETIRAYTHHIAQRGGAIAAEIFGTEIIDCPGSSMRQCNFTNVRMPLAMRKDNEDKASQSSSVKDSDEHKAIPREHGHLVSDWIKLRGVEESGIYFQTFPYYSKWLWRLSGMIYIEEADFRKGAEILKALCERAQRGEYLPGKSSAEEVASDPDDVPAYTPDSSRRSSSHAR